MKKALVFLICLLLTLPACAESCYISEDMPALEITCGIVGEQALDEFFQPVILQFALTDTRTGEQLTPVYALSEAVWVPDAAYYALDDVNFDGCSDLVIATAIGASNASYTFYLWDADTQTFVWYGGPSLWNYALYPEQNAVLSQGTSGYAGLLHEQHVYVWNDDKTDLILERSSEWSTLQDESYEDAPDGFLVVTHYDDSQLCETYCNHLTGELTTETFPISRYEEDSDFLDSRLTVEEDFINLPRQDVTYNDGTNG